MKPIHGLAVLLLASLAACGGNDNDAGKGGGRNEPAVNGTFTTAMSTDPGNLNPLTAVQPTANTIRSFAYDSLVHVDRKGQVVPRVAASWKATPTSVTFTLNKGVTCTDGTDVTASVVAKTFEWIKNPDNGSTLIGGNLPSTDFDVKADDTANTVTVTVPQPYGFLLEGAGLVPIVCPKGLADPDSLAQHTDGTGPFVLTEYVADDHLTMEARKGYAWGPDGATTDEPGFPAKVVFRIVQDPTTAVNMFLAGELSAVTPSHAEKPRVQGKGTFTLTAASGPLEFFFNQRPGFPGADIAVRRALTMALDLGELTQVFTEGDGQRADSLTVIPPRPCPADTVKGHLPEHDADAAAEVLDEAGWTKGDDGIRRRDGKPLAVTLGYPSGEKALDAGMELVTKAWEDLGVQVKARGQGTNAYVKTLFGGTDWDVAFLNVQIAYPSDFMSFATGSLPPKGQNFAAIDHADYGPLAGQAASTPTDAGACDMWGQAEQKLFDNLDVVPVSNTVVTTYSRNAEFVEGITSPVEPTSIRLYSK